MLIITQCLGAVCSAAFIALIIIISVINEAGGKIGGFIVWVFVVFCGGLVFSAIGIVKTKNHYGLKKSFYECLKDGDLRRTRAHIELYKSDGVTHARGHAKLPRYYFRFKLDSYKYCETGRYDFSIYQIKNDDEVAILYSLSKRKIFILKEN